MNCWSLKLHNFAHILIDVTTKIMISRNIICIQEGFNTNISHKLFNYNSLCEFTALEDKFKKWF